jgi:hypothetical protein
MSSQLLSVRKRRTRQHVIADLSVHHVEGFILEQGHAIHRLNSDYGYDLEMFTFDAEGYAEPGFVLFQVKAAETWQAVDRSLAFDIDIRDYNLWMEERMPVILVLFDVSRRRTCWIAIQKYFVEDTTRLPKEAAKTVRVRVPDRQVMSRRAIERLRNLKWEWQSRAQGAPT